MAVGRQSNHLHMVEWQNCPCSATVSGLTVNRDAPFIPNLITGWFVGSTGLISEVVLLEEFLLYFSWSLSTICCTNCRIFWVGWYAKYSSLVFHLESSTRMCRVLLCFSRWRVLPMDWVVCVVHLSSGLVIILSPLALVIGAEYFCYNVFIVLADILHFLLLHCLLFLLLNQFLTALFLRLRLLHIVLFLEIAILSRLVVLPLIRRSERTVSIQLLCWSRFLDPILLFGNSSIHFPP